MIKKMLGVFTSVIAALAVVGVAWAGTDDATSTSVTTAGETSTSVSIDDSSSSTDATIASSTDATVQSSTEATVASSTGVTVDSSTSTSLDDSSTATSIDDSSSSTSTSIASSTSTSVNSGSTTSTTVNPTTSTSTDDNERSVVPDGVTVHTIPGVGSVTIEASSGQLILVDVTAPGWNVEFDKVESDRIELEFTTAADAEAEFEARINDGRIEVRIEVD